VPADLRHVQTLQLFGREAQNHVSESVPLFDLLMVIHPDISGKTTANE
jgi:hypothetical protein